MRMPFGKHKGEHLEDVPILYLHWTFHNYGVQRADLAEAIKEQLELRWPHEVAMPFGKHRGEYLADIPKSYLEWLSGQDISEALRAAVCEFLAVDGDGVDDDPPDDWFWGSSGNESRRGRQPDGVARPPTAPAELLDSIAEIIKRGFRATAAEHHPDHGGTDDKMREVIAAREWMEKHLL